MEYVSRQRLDVRTFSKGGDTSINQAYITNKKQEISDYEENYGKPARQTAAEVASLASDFLPGVSFGKAVVEATPGKDPFTEEKLSPLGQTFAGVDVALSLIPGFGPGVKASKELTEQAIKHGDELTGAIGKHVDELAEGTGELPKVNIDTGTANAFISEGSPIRHELKAYVNGKQMVMTDTAAGEFRNIINGVAGPLEKARAERFMNRVQVIPDNPSSRAMNLVETKKVGANDKIIFGTGDNLGITTMTGDAKFVRGASAQGVDFDAYIHSPVPLGGK